MSPSPHAAPDLRGATFADALATHGERIALVTGDGELSYRELAARVERFRPALGAGRRLVLLEASNTVDSVVAYLAALTAGHPVLLTPGGNDGATAALLDAYDPDVVVRATGGRCAVEQRRTASVHTLHPDLALLLSTSGSTGAPKLVRLSHRNLQANAEAIAEYLGIRGSDRAATTLPIHYCYGLSVVNSHLLRGAGVVLTDLSVADTCFWDLFRRTGATTFAAVPYTFDLLDRVGFAGMRLPDLRYVTQAGGRLAPDRVRHYAELGQRNGWDLFVMYGQTEATARMAYLPPDLAATNPESIGRPVPGGSFRLDPVPGCADGPDTGELVYRGPNVMLGYAHTPADLADGRTLDELRTGDLARRSPDGLYEVIGRRSRFVKAFGLRVDLDRMEQLLAEGGVTAACAGSDDRLVVAAQGPADPADVARLAAAASGLPARAVRVHVVAVLPRLASGKIDHRAVAALSTVAQPAAPARRGAAGPAADGHGAPVDLRALYAEILDRSDVTDDSTFVSLGGDSLSYVEMSLRLEQALGHLPAGWHTTRIGDLRPRTPRRERRRPRLDTSVALRAVAIVLIVGSHIHLLDLPGGAHVLIGVAGYNFARFHLAGARRTERTGRLAASIGRIAVPSMIWIALVHALTDDYALANVFLLNEVAGARVGTERYFWFVESLVYILLALLALFAVPALDRLERRAPFALPMALAGVALLARYDLPLVDRAVHIPTPVDVFWLFALGWAAAKATGRAQRCWVTVAVVATLPGYFDKPGRVAVVIAGLVLLVWVARLPGTRVLNRLAGVLASSSLYIYLTHWHVYPYLDDISPVLALVASLVAGVGYAALTAAALTRLRRLRAGRGRPVGPAPVGSCAPGPAAVGSAADPTPVGAGSDAPGR